MKAFHLAVVILFDFIAGALGQTSNGLDPVTRPIEEVRKAYESEDINRIKELSALPSEQDRLVVIASDAPRSAWRNQVTLVLLEAPWPSDRQPGKPSPPGTPPPLRLYQLAVELLSPVLPDEKLKLNDDDTYQKLGTVEGRELLVAKYREAREKQESGDLPDGDPSRGNTSGTADEHGDNVAELSNRNNESERAQASDPPADEWRPHHYILVLPTALLLGVLVFALKRRN